MNIHLITSKNMEKKYIAKTVIRAAIPRSKRLREQGVSGTSGDSSTIVSVESSSMTTAGDGHTHANKSILDEIRTDNDRYIYLTKLEENADGTDYESVEKKAKAGYADEAGHAIDADNAGHADKAYDIDVDSPVYDKFLRKDVADIAAKITTFLEGLYVGNSGHGISVSDFNVVTAIFDELKNIFGIVSSDFVSGDLGTGFSLKYNQEAGRSYLEVDELLVRKLAYFVELIIKRLSYVGGEIILTPASMKCVKVEEYDTCYRCYFEQDNGDKSIIQEFRIDDQVRAQTFNIKEGTSHNATNNYYWRLVVAIGDNYVDLSKADCDTGSGVPEAGDSIVQLGNRTDVTRQNAIILSTVGEDAPSIKQYKGIDGYSLAGREVTIISPLLNKFIGQFISEATGKSYDSMFNELQADLGLIKEQTDKEYTLWFFDYDPAMDNLPAADWDTDALKIMHEQDMFYNRLTGYAYRFEKDGDIWVWNSIADQQTVKALEDASKAQDTADGKRRTFIAEPTDAQAYDVGDLWVNATYSQGDERLYENDTLVCQVAKTAGTAFNIEHWRPSNNATTAYMRNLGDVIEMGADRIEFTGKTIINGSFVVDEDSNLTLNNITANNLTLSGNIDGIDATLNNITAHNLTLSGEINGIDATLDNITLNNVNAKSGTIGNFEISSGRIGIQADPDSSGGNGMFLYNRMIGFNDDSRQVIVGTWSSLGEDILGRFIDTKPTSSSTKTGILIDITGASIDDGNYSLGNNAIRISRGNVCGLRRRLRRVRISTVLSKYDSIVCCVNTEEVTVTLPDEAEDGQEFWMMSLNRKKVNVNASGRDTISSSGSFFSTDRWHVYIYDAHNHVWLYSYMNYD